jgi:hypothetical protein
LAPTGPEYAAVHSALHTIPDREWLSWQRCGAGMRQASAFCETLDAHSLNCFVLVGWAGGLSSELQPGDIVLGERALTAGETPVACTIPKGIQEKLEQAGIGKARTGDMLTTARVLATPEAKLAVQETAALAVEMEAYPLAAWAHTHNLPFIHARVILDAVHESLPELGDSIDELGRPRILPILALLLRKPALISQVWFLALRIRRLNSRLAALAGVLAEVLATSDGPF